MIDCGVAPRTAPVITRPTSAIPVEGCAGSHSVFVYSTVATLGNALKHSLAPGTTAGNGVPGRSDPSRPGRCNRFLDEARSDVTKLSRRGNRSCSEALGIAIEQARNNLRLKWEILPSAPIEFLLVRPHGQRR